MDNDNIIVLTDENGNEEEFEFLDLIEHEGAEYVVLYPVNEDSGEVVILLVEELDEENDNYIAVEDMALLDTLFEIFKERNKNYLDFAE